MGKRVRFRCSCGYRQDVSGGPDAGMWVSTQTIVCKQCRKLFDVIVGHTTSPDPVPIQCPKDVAHEVAEWSAGDPCPRCGKALVDAGELIILWD